MNVSHQALGTDISPSLRVRTLCKRFEIVALVCTSMLVLVAGYIWDPSKLLRFQFFCCGLVILSWSAMHWSARTLTSVLSRELQDAKENSSVAAGWTEAKQASMETISDESRRSLRAPSPAPEPTTPSPKALSSSPPVHVVAMQIATNKHFLVWLLTQFCVYCNTCFQNKFFHLFSAELFKGTWAHGQGPAMLGIARVAQGAASFFVVLPAVEHSGLYMVFMTGCLVSLTSSVIGWSWAMLWPALLLPIAFSCSVVFSSHKAVVGMFIADLVDEDCVMHRRRKPLSSTFFAARSFFTVWAESLVPMATVYALTRSGYDPSRGDASVSRTARDAMTAMWWGVPMALTFVQVMLMSRGFGLRGSYLDDVRRRRSALYHASAPSHAT